MTHSNSSSGERRPATPRVELTPQNRPLAGRSSYEARLAAWRAGFGPKPEVAPYLGLEAPIPYPIDVGLMFPPIEETSPRSAMARICVACALGGATVTALASIAVFALTRSAAALVPALPPRVPMEQDVTFGAIAFGISALFAFAVALYGIFRREQRP